MVNQVKECPILFSAPMVRAILDGRKTQTRRIVKKQISDDHKFQGWIIESTDSKRKGCASWGVGDGALVHDLVAAKCPYGNLGDRLWVRETFSSHIGNFGESIEYAYKATHDDRFGPWAPSIHMPRSASRILLEVTNVRIERLQDISLVDAVAEGWIGHIEPLRWYRIVWESINGQGSWDLNPWVWVVEFKVISK